MEEMGRALFPSPYLSSVVLGADLILTCGIGGRRSRNSSPASPPASVGWPWPNSRPTGRLGCRRDHHGRRAATASDLVLAGTKSFVLDGHTADTLLVAVRTERVAPGDDGDRLVVVDGDAPGRVAAPHRDDGHDPQAGRDRFRRGPGAGVGDPRGRRIGVGGARRHPHPGRGGARLRAGGRGAASASRCRSSTPRPGCSSAARSARSRPSSTSAPTCSCCVESAKSAAYHAGWAVADGDAEAGIAAPLAKSYCSEAYFRCAAENIQIHGGIGFTWEHDAHLLLQAGQDRRVALRHAGRAPGDAGRPPRDLRASASGGGIATASWRSAGDRLRGSSPVRSGPPRCHRGRSNTQKGNASRPKAVADGVLADRPRSSARSSPSSSSHAEGG